MKNIKKKLHFIVYLHSAYGKNGKIDGVHKANGANGNKARGCILYQTRVLCQLYRRELIQCLYSFSAIFLCPKTPQLQAFLAVFVLHHIRWRPFQVLNYAFESPILPSTVACPPANR